MIQIGFTLDGGWAEARDIFNRVSGGQLKRALGGALAKEALILSGKVKEKIRNGPFTPLSPWTMASRKLNKLGGSKPLIATSTLFQSVTVVPSDVTSLSKFIGIPRKAMSRERRVVDIVEIIEEGRTFAIAVTPKMLAFLFGVLIKKIPKSLRRKSSGDGTLSAPFIIVHIPPRPFITPIVEEAAGSIIPRVRADVEKRLERILSAQGK